MAYDDETVLEAKRLIVQKGKTAKQAAQTMLREDSPDSELRNFGKRIERKKGKKKAAVAVARKLSVVMHTLWVTGREYDPWYYENHHGEKPS